MIPDQALAPIKARLEAATDGARSIFRYDYGGGRVFVEAGNGRRELIADAYKVGDLEFQAEAPADIARLLTAIDAVEKLHLPRIYDGKVVCDECTGHGAVLYPCPTVAALSEALAE